MTPKQTALYNLAMFFATALVAGSGVAILLSYFSITQLGIGFTALMLISAAKMVYDYEVDRAERLQKLNDLAK